MDSGIRKRRIAREDLLRMHTRGQVVEDYRDHHARPTNASLAMTNRRIDADLLLPLRHDLILNLRRETDEIFNNELNRFAVMVFE